MGQFEDNTHAFIVRIWREGRETVHLPATWRGVIEHVPSGERRYIKNLDDVVAFIEPYLGHIGVQWRAGRRLKRWLRRWLSL